MISVRCEIFRNLLVFLVVLLMSNITLASKSAHYRQHQIILKIARDVSTPAKKAAAVASLISILQDENADIHLREFAAVKLGDLKAVQAKEKLKALSESLEFSDSERYLRWNCFLAYWQIKIEEASDKKIQSKLLKEALNVRLDGIIAGSVQDWAADELANRGEKEALPAIIESIRFSNPGKRGEEHIRLCTIKIDLLTKSKKRFDALNKALEMEDDTEYQKLKKWAVEEMGNLKTEQSKQRLISFARKLQKDYYDENGKRIFKQDDRLSQNAGELYRSIMCKLKCMGMKDTELKAAGLKFDKYFMTHGSYGVYDCD